MLTFFIYLLTAVLVIDCVFLVLLVLVQLPKKEAGMGQAFGGAATDALFGAGSGNVLTRMTKWGAGIFFALSISLTIMGTYKTTSGTGR
jgi:preprotein translocase subunit SecG